MSGIEHQLEMLKSQVKQLQTKNHDLVKALAVLAEMFRRFDHQINFSLTPTRECAGRFDITMEADGNQRSKLDLDVRYLDDNTVQIRFLDSIEASSTLVERNNVGPSKDDN
jgi:hypothetical protein